MPGRVVINPQIRNVGPAGLKLLWYQGTSIKGARQVAEQLAYLAKESPLTVLVSQRFLGATFDEKEIFMVGGSEEYAARLARVGVVEIHLPEGSDFKLVASTLDTLVGSSLKRTQRLLEAKGIKVSLSQREKILPRIPDCHKIKAGDFVRDSILHKFALGKSVDTNRVLDILHTKFASKNSPFNLLGGPPINKVVEAERVSEANASKAKAELREYVSSLSQKSRDLVVEALVAGSWESGRRVDKEFITELGLEILKSFEVLLLSIRRNIISDMEIFNYTERICQTIEEKKQIFLAIASKGSVDLGLFLGYFGKVYGLQAYRGTAEKETISEILCVYAKNRSLSDNEIDLVMETAENYLFNEQEKVALIIAIAIEGKMIFRPKVLELGRHSILSPGRVAEIIKCQLKQTKVIGELRIEHVKGGYEPSETYEPGTNEVVEIPVWVPPHDVEHDNRKTIFREACVSEALAIIQAHHDSKWPLILSSLEKLDRNLASKIGAAISSAAGPYR